LPNRRGTGEILALNEAGAAVPAERDLSRNYPPRRTPLVLMPEDVAFAILATPIRSGRSPAADRRKQRQRGRSFRTALTEVPLHEVAGRALATPAFRQIAAVRQKLPIVPAAIPTGREGTISLAEYYLVTAMPLEALAVPSFRRSPQGD
jgi:hypothetical protein